jgi:hypothetical protein
VESSIVTTGGTATANRPQFFRKLRRSSSDWTASVSTGSISALMMHSPLASVRSMEAGSSDMQRFPREPPYQMIGSNFGG